MNEEEKNTVEELEKQLRLSMNVDDITTTIRNDEAQIILNLINKLQKENEELKNDYENLNNSLVVKNHCIKNSIPVQKVKDKIKEIDEKIKREENEKVVIYLHKQKRILQELLEGRK